MNKKLDSKNIWIIGGIVLSYIVLLVVIIILAVNLSNMNNRNDKSSNKVSSEEEVFKNIRLDEDFTTDGIIENLEGVRWNNARIMQNDGRLELSLMLNNESQDKKIGKQKLKVILLDKAGKEIVSKDVNLKGIDANYGYSDINFSIEMNELVIVNDIKIVASKEENKEEKDSETSEDLNNTNDDSKTKEAEKKEKNK